MTITRGFGTTFDLASGRARTWFVGADGMKRWASTGQPIDVGAIAAIDQSRSDISGESQGAAVAALRAIVDKIGHFADLPRGHGLDLLDCLADVADIAIRGLRDAGEGGA